ncbi:DNA primase large subunit [Trichuris trichiura]|uniref:DNA primase large subunit n=1 Tax=Trichuris trichiura TaxID=36087 RepID=A0A077ZC74_TRITR|nr:DNA primase large subunit [Trichuris trichiura]
MDITSGLPSSRDASMVLEDPERSSCIETAWMQHNLQFYWFPLDDEIGLADMFDLAYRRQRALLAIESAGRKFPKFTDDYFSLVDCEFRKMSLTFPFFATNPEKETSEEVVELRRSDVQSHFVLMLAYANTAENRQWFLQQEVNLFRWRLETEGLNSLRLFLQANNINYSPLSMDEKEALWRQIYAATGCYKTSLKEKFEAPSEEAQEEDVKKLDFFKVVEGVSFVSIFKNYIQVPFEDIPDLVKARKVMLHGGNAIVPQIDFIGIVVNIFRNNLSTSLAKVAKNICLVESDARISALFNMASIRGCSVYDYADLSEGKEVTVEMLDKLSVTSFPPCMRRLFEELKSRHHLRHGGRLQLGLFLKRLGLSLESSLKFWQTHFSPIVDEQQVIAIEFEYSQFERHYAYNIRHSYGEAGRRCNYSAYSCLKIIMGSTPGPQDFHGCPFKHCDVQVLRQLLTEWGIGKDDAEKIVEFSQWKRYDRACTKFFECSHGLKENSTAQLVYHPNQYFDDSRKLLFGVGDEETQPTSS